MNARKSTGKLTEKKLLSLDEGAAYLSVSKNTLRKIATEAGCIVKYGRRSLLKREGLDAWVDRQ